MRRIATAALIAATALAVVVAPAASAAPKPAAPKTVTLTPEQLTAAGFPVAVNTTAWGSQPVTLSATSAQQWADVVAKGRAPEYVPVGQVLTMQRFYATSTTGSGDFKALNVTTTVQPDRSFVLHFQLGYVGTWGYRVGYSTSGPSPEFPAFQFQFTTTPAASGGKTAPAAPKPTDKAVILTSKELAAGGFTKTPNVIGWDSGTATLSAHKAKAGTPITISGKAPAPLTPGTILSLQRFVATDRLGSGSFVPVGNAITAVQADQTYSLTFEVDQRGVAGYTVGAVSGDQWLGVEFQVKTT